MKLSPIAVAMSALALAACSPAAKIGNGKQGAAEALYAASMPTSAKTDTAGAGVDVSGSVSFSCPEGGTASLSNFQASLSLDAGVSFGSKFKLAYDQCGLAKADVGVAVYNGSFDVTRALVAGGGSATYAQTFKGKVLVQGAFDDFLEVDATQNLAASALNGTGSVAMTLKGTVSVSSGTYTYDEAVNVTAGQLSVQRTSNTSK